MVTVLLEYIDFGITDKFSQALRIMLALCLMLLTTYAFLKLCWSLVMIKCFAYSIQNFLTLCGIFS